MVIVGAAAGQSSPPQLLVASSSDILTRSVVHGGREHSSAGLAEKLVNGPAGNAAVATKEASYSPFHWKQEALNRLSLRGQKFARQKKMVD